MRRVDWKPILQHDLIHSAEAAISNVSADITRISPSTLSSATLSESALLFAYLAQVQTCSSWHDRSVEYLNLAIERISAGIAPPPALYGGLTEVGWVVQHMIQLWEEYDMNTGAETCVPPEDDPIAQIDEITLRRIRDPNGIARYDLVSGLVGVGIYFLQRLPRKCALQGVRLILDRLHNQAQEIWPGLAWLTPPELIRPSQRENFPFGYYNLGVAHGAPGVIYFLTETLAVGIDVERTTELLEKAVKWLLAQERPPQATTRFSSWIWPGTEPQDSRLGWCYGDVGVAGVLQHCAIRLDKQDWLQRAKILLDGCLTVPDDRTGVRDAMLCHGATGVAHVYNRSFQATSEPKHKVAANFWFQRALEMRKDGIGVGGFVPYGVGPRSTWKSDPSLLSGSIGVALALLAAIYPLEPRWDRILLLSNCGVRNPA